MEKALNERVLSDKKREAIKKALDYEDAKELFEQSAVEASIAGSFVNNDVNDCMDRLNRLGESQDSLLMASFNGEAVYSDDHEVPQEELTGEDLQFALKGEPYSDSSEDSY